MYHRRLDGRVAPVRLPKSDPRQPLQEQEREWMAEPEHPEVASSEAPPFTVISTTPTHAPAPAPAPHVTVNLSVTSKSDTCKGEEEASKFTCTKRITIRGTRGRGDPRNEGMKRAREHYEREKLEQQRMTQEQAHDWQKRKMTAKEHTVILRGRGQSRFGLKSTQDSTEDSPDQRRDTTFPQHHSRTSPTGRRTQTNGKVIMIHGPPSSTGRRSNVFQRSPPQAPRVTMQQTQGGPMVRRLDDWTHWVELSVRLFGLPTNVTTRDLWRCFSKEGSIATIEIYEDNGGNRDGKARIRFNPPPAKPFWQGEAFPLQLKGVSATTPIRLELEYPRRTFLHPSPVKEQFKYPELMLVHAESIDFGFMYDPKTMMGMYRVAPTLQLGLTFCLNMLRREIEVRFQLHIRDGRTQQVQPALAPGAQPRTSIQIGKHNRTETYRFRIPFAQLQTVHEIQTEDGHNVLVFPMDNPPSFYRKVNELDTLEDDATYWNSNDAWYRQTDIVYAPNHLKSASLTLKKTRPIIDLGRWITYRFVFDMSKNDRPQYALICKALRDYNVEVVPFPDFKVVTDREPAVWEYIDKPISKQKRTGNLLDELIIDSVPLLSFPIRYQLEVCISQGCLNEHNLTRDFVNSLMGMEETKAQEVLEYVANQKSRIYDPMEIFKIKVVKGTASRLKIPHYCAYTRSATVTPSTVYYNTPTVETSNRVVRQYSEYADRFLRVRFTDEKFQASGIHFWPGILLIEDREESIRRTQTRITRSSLVSSA